MVRVLIAHAEGSRSEQRLPAAIAAGITEELGARASIEIASIDDQLELERADVYVCGSALHRGRWLRSAERFAIKNRYALAHRPIALYSTVTAASDAHSVRKVRQAIARGQLDRFLSYQLPIPIASTDRVASALLSADSLFARSALSLFAGRLFFSDDEERELLETCRAFGRRVGARVYSDWLEPPFQLYVA